MKIKKLLKIRYLRSKLRSISANFFASRIGNVKNQRFLSTPRIQLPEFLAFLIRIFDDAASCEVLNPKILIKTTGQKILVAFTNHRSSSSDFSVFPDINACTSAPTTAFHQETSSIKLRGCS